MIKRKNLQPRIKLLVTIAIICLGTDVASQSISSLKEVYALNKGVMIFIPVNFSVMDAETLALKYPNAGHRPSEVYTNERGTINVALNHTQNKATEANLPDVKKAMETQFNRAPFTFIKSELKEMNGSQFVILEFISPAVDTKIYNLMAIASLEGRLVMITFNCTEAERKEWEATGKKIIGSITLKK
jgi:hypothetical protein